ncbi:helix-turn-helix transcriptional regulator [uncultured Gemella sp.]|uniref:helix-turn-helix domain-containing protein n=1 Tax=uncultured Gemella sp. TaxID=254352 RepID=UPI0028D6B567|nr:helix-turn-helix transcriptional regulator [uncultured Gemella sp.]
MKIDKKAVGRRIRQIRMNKGYTLEEFGKLFEANKSIVLRWENGTSLPHKGRLISISKLANLSINELLYGDSEKDIEELYQELMKLSKEELIILMLRIAQNKGEQQCK